MRTPEDVLSISEFNSLVKECLEGNPLLSGATLRGEISNFKVYPSGHCYFSLKDETSILSCVLWATNRFRVHFAPKNGDEVIVRGRISVYPPRGTYQFSVDRMEMDGEGAAKAALKKLLEKLKAQGLFDESRKKPLPAFPKAIAIIAGKGSAGMKDIVVNAKKRWPLTELLEIPSLVQGIGAPEDLVRAVQEAKKASPDVLIIGRGGGSSEDLSAFNDEALVLALSELPFPVISAVGHEIDVTLTDLVADRRASTPTGAAVMATPNKEDVFLFLDDAETRLSSVLKAKLEYWKAKLRAVASRPVFASSRGIYGAKRENLSSKSRRLDAAAMRKWIEEESRIREVRQAFRSTCQKGLSNRRFLLEAKRQKLSALNPCSVLNRGFSLTEAEDGKVIQSLDEVRPGQTLKTKLRDGIIVSTVEKKERTNGR